MCSADPILSATATKPRQQKSAAATCVSPALLSAWHSRDRWFIKATSFILENSTHLTEQIPPCCLIVFTLLSRSNSLSCLSSYLLSHLWFLSFPLRDFFILLYVSNWNKCVHHTVSIQIHEWRAKTSNNFALSYLGSVNYTVDCYL